MLLAFYFSLIHRNSADVRQYYDFQRENDNTRFFISQKKKKIYKNRLLLFVTCSKEYQILYCTYVCFSRFSHVLLETCLSRKENTYTSYIDTMKIDKPSKR